MCITQLIFRDAILLAGPSGWHKDPLRIHVLRQLGTARDLPASRSQQEHSLSIFPKKQDLEAQTSSGILMGFFLPANCVISSLVECSCS